MSDYILCHIQGRHLEQRRKEACRILADSILPYLHETDVFARMFDSIYSPVICRSLGRYRLGTKVTFDVRFSVMKGWEDDV